MNRVATFERLRTGAKLTLLCISLFVFNACGRTWSLEVISEASAPRILRAFDGSTVIDRMVQPGGGAWVWIGTRPISGPILVIDPLTCTELSRQADLPKVDAVAQIGWDDTLIVKGEGEPADFAAFARETIDHSCPVR